MPGTNTEILQGAKTNYLHSICGATNTRPERREEATSARLEGAQNHAEKEGTTKTTDNLFLI